MAEPTPAKCHCGSSSWGKEPETSRYTCVSCYRPLWMPIATAPRDGHEILVFAFNENGDVWGQDIVWWDQHMGEWVSGSYNWHTEDADKDGILVYWMPLLEPPKLD